MWWDVAQSSAWNTWHPSWGREEHNLHLSASHSGNPERCPIQAAVDGGKRPRVTPGRTEADVRLGGQRLLLSVFAAGARCLVQIQAPKPAKEKVAQGHKEKGISQELLKPWEKEF